MILLAMRKFPSVSASRPQSDRVWPAARLIAPIVLSLLLQAPLLLAFYRRLLLERPSPAVGDPPTTLISAAWSAISSLVSVEFGIPSRL